MHTIWGLLDVVPVIAGRYDDLLKRSAGVSAWGHAVRLAHPADLLATLRPDRARKDAARRVDLETAAAGLARGRATPHRLEAVRAGAPTAAVRIRPEAPGDREAIRAVEFAAFENDPHRAPGSPPVEHRIVDALRDAGALALSLVAEGDDGVVGHVAFSPVRIDARQVGWFGLGPVAVRPDRQGRGIGATLIRHGIEAMRDRGARGLVLVGEPAYYHRFGFRACPGLMVEGVPPEYFMCLPFGPPPPRGGLTYHEAFLVDAG
jgi:putative acetyltransferase